MCWISVETIVEKDCSLTRFWINRHTYNRMQWAGGTGDYIGESTKSEIEYSLAHGKKIEYLEK